MNPEKICVIHLNQIGDLVFSMPLLKALRTNFPDAVIHSVVKPYLMELLEGSPYVDKIIPRPDAISDKKGLLVALRNERYDLLFCLPRSEESLIMTTFSNADVKVGFSHFPWDFGLDIKETVQGHNCWRNNAKLLKRLNIQIFQDNYVGLIPTDADIHELELPQRFVVISPGASGRRQTKTWLEKNFARLMGRLWELHGFTPVLVGSAENGKANARIIQLALKQKSDDTFLPLDLSGKIGLRALCALLTKAALFVGIDSGVMHLASAVNIPVVGLFGPTDPYYVGPQNHQSRVVRRNDLDCAPCYLKKCSHANCMQQLSVEQVMNACDELLDSHAA
ncbi:lipopolysaccharide heptosyltransferase I [Desulfosarcina ovata subsp. ovata]|uniref:Lipopolysaccharide heptosyltransferase I n=2 Tax=Desulfosarcina ovata TaxID=83564 RepID=A0A5K8A5P3_9BACT|nr:lipopolysaccharide heptosyltransferase I [Desulfosarcina ovata subsp. ovata]